MWHICPVTRRTWLELGRERSRRRESCHTESQLWLLLKLDSVNIFFLERETEWKWTNRGKGSLNPPQLVTTLKQLTVMCAEMKATKTQEGANGHWLQCWRRKERGEVGGCDKLESSSLIPLSRFDVSVTTIYFYHSRLLVNTWWQRITFVSRGGALKKIC